MNDHMRKTLLVVLAHPDDESFPIGGTLAKYAAEGVEITLICATLGEMGIPDLEPAQAAIIREKELKEAASVLGLHKVQFMRYPDGSLPNADPEQVVSQLMNAMRRLRPNAVITFGPDGISGHPDHVAISRLVTTAFDRSIPESFVPLSAKLFYITPSEATLQGCGVLPSQELAGGPVASIDISNYRLSKVRAMQCYESQNPPFKGKPETEIENLACHEYFTLARPAGNYASFSDLFAPLIEQKELSA
jgi:LmbE family N-acetylglucosaminyl deacetylase